MRCCEYYIKGLTKSSHNDCKQQKPHLKLHATRTDLTASIHKQNNAGNQTTTHKCVQRRQHNVCTDVQNTIQHTRRKRFGGGEEAYHTKPHQKSNEV